MYETPTYHEIINILHVNETSTIIKSHLNGVSPLKNCVQ